jgi:tRNA (guanine-N7-)-methyltransferase
MLPDQSFDAVKLLFPDPWPKKRHHKRRIVQPPFVAEVARVLKPGGLFHVATDWMNYAEQIREVLGATAAFSERTEESLAGEPLAFRAPTKFERRGRRLGHQVVDCFYVREPASD